MTIIDVQNHLADGHQPQDTDGPGSRVARAGRRIAAALVGPLVLLGTRPVEDLDDIDGGDIPGPVLENPHLRAEASRMAHGRI